jgi:hypothetical protein
MKSNSGGFTSGPHAFLAGSGSKISPLGESDGASALTPEYSPPTTYTRPSGKIPEAKSSRIVDIGSGPDQVPVG